MFDPKRSSVKPVSVMTVEAGLMTAEFIRGLTAVERSEGLNVQDMFNSACRQAAHGVAMPPDGPYLLTDGKYSFQEGAEGKVLISCPVFNQMGSPGKPEVYIVPADAPVQAAPTIKTFDWSL